MQLEKTAAVTNSGAIVKGKGFSSFKYCVVLAGISLSLGTELISDNSNIWYLLWAMSPYGVYYMAAWKTEGKSQGATIGGGVLLLAADVLVRIEVFYFPGSSTDSIALLTMPFWQCMVIMPAGLLLGWLVEKAAKTRLTH